MKFNMLLVLALLSTISCASKKKTLVTDVSQLSPVLEVTKTPCFGRCPTFTLTIYENGLAVLDGKQNIEQIGLSHKVLDKTHMNELLDACETGALFNLKDSYMEKIMDLPTTTLKYFKDGKTKVITGNRNFPEGFLNVVDHCMQIVKGDGWELKEAYNTK